VENLLPRSVNTSVTADQGYSLEATYLNQADTEEELEEEPQGILDIEMAKQSKNNNKSPGIDNTPRSFKRKEDCYLIKYIASDN
jgi:hypothetical protein